MILRFDIVKTVNDYNWRIAFVAPFLPERRLTGIALANASSERRQLLILANRELWAEQ